MSSASRLLLCVCLQSASWQAPRNAPNFRSFVFIIVSFHVFAHSFINWKKKEVQMKSLRIQRKSCEMKNDDVGLVWSVYAPITWHDVALATPICRDGAGSINPASRASHYRRKSCFSLEYWINCNAFNSNDLDTLPFWCLIIAGSRCWCCRRNFTRWLIDASFGTELSPPPFRRILTQLSHCECQPRTGTGTGTSTSIVILMWEALLKS